MGLGNPQALLRSPWTGKVPNIPKALGSFGTSRIFRPIEILELLGVRELLVKDGSFEGTCQDPGSSQGPSDLHSDALSAELLRPSC